MLANAFVLLAAFCGADVQLPPFRHLVVDDKVGIGYGLAIADVDGDKKPDILLVDKDLVAWYQNPDWQKHVIARKLTQLDHVCIAARDLDGDGKCEIAVGAGWNPSDTAGSGSLHYLVPPADRTQLWTPIALPHEPTEHRIRWLYGAGNERWLVSAPLHGRGNKNSEGVGVKIRAFERPSDPSQPWRSVVIDDSLHVTHNLEIVGWDEQNPNEQLLVAGKEGLFHFAAGKNGWEKRQLAGSGKSSKDFPGASEIRTGRLPAPKDAKDTPGDRFLVSIEPFHGNSVVAYTGPEWKRRVLDDSLNGGHALGCGDLLGKGSAQIVAGWRVKDKAGKVGLRVFIPQNSSGETWDRATLDDNTMACEDLQLHDLNGDGKLDVIAAGRDTHNLKIYINERS